MIKFACPGCQASFSVGDDKAGKTGKCPKCGSQFEIPKLEVASAPPPPPPPPPTPTPASSFAFDDAPPEPEKPKKGKKSPSKADLDDDDDDDKGKDDGDDRDDDDDDDTPGKKASAGKGMAIGAAVANILMALALGACGGYNGLKGLCCGAVSDVKTQSTLSFKFPTTTQPKTAEEKKLEDLLDPEKARKAQYVAYATGAMSVLTAFVLLIASIGCFMRKPFGKIGTFIGTFFGLIATGFMFVIALVIVGTSHMTWLDYLGGIGGAFATVLVGGFACFAVIKGIPKGGAKAAKKSDDDEDEESEEEPEEEEKPAPKKKKKVEADDEEEEPKPKKKKKVEEDDEDEPKPKKKKRREDDDD